MTDYFKLREELQTLAAKASEDHDVEVSWYNVNGYQEPQFENSRGSVAQDKGDYEFYAALRTAWPAIEDALFLAGGRVTRVEIKNPNKRRGMTVLLNDKPVKLTPHGSCSFDAIIPAEEPA